MALFRDTEDFAKDFPALESATWAMLEPFVELAEHRTFRDEVLGPALYDALHAAFQASIAESPTPLPAPFAALLPKVRRAAAYLAAYDAAPVLNVSFDSAGMTSAETSNRKPATMWRTKMALSGILAQGYGWLDQCIRHLQDNDATLTQWASSPLRAAIRESFIRDMRHVTPYLRIAGPWMLHKLRPAMRAVQVGPVRKTIGQAHYDSILSKLNTGGTLSQMEADILEHARPAMLHLALADQVVPLSLTLDDDGAWTWQSATSGSGISGGKMPATNDKINAMVRSNQVTGNTHLAQLHKLIHPNEDNLHFPSGESGSFFFTG